MDADIYRSFEIADAEIRPMKATQGARVSQFLVEISRRAAVGSQELETGRGPSGCR